MDNRAILFDAILAEVEFQVFDRKLDLTMTPEVVAAKISNMYMMPTREYTIESVVTEWLDDYIILDEEDWD